jgi:hypothetical protein
MYRKRWKMMKKRRQWRQWQSLRVANEVAPGR